MKKRKSMAGQEPEYVLYWPYMVAIIPYYDESNNTCSRVHYLDGNTSEHPVRCEQILEQLAVAFYTSLEVIRGRAAALCDENDEEELCQELRKVPSALTKDYIFLPVKCRREQVRNSGTLGYVLYQYIKHVKWRSGSRCQIVLKYGLEPLEIQQHKRGIQNQLKLAARLQKELEAEEQHWQYETCIARKRMQERIQEHIQKQNDNNAGENTGEDTSENTKDTVENGIEQ